MPGQARLRDRARAAGHRHGRTRVRWQRRHVRERAAWGLDQTCRLKTKLCEGFSWAVCAPAHRSIPAFGTPEDLSTCITAHEVHFEQETWAPSLAAHPSFSRHRRTIPGTYLVSQPSLNSKTQDPLQRPFQKLGACSPGVLLHKANEGGSQDTSRAHGAVHSRAASPSSPPPVPAGMRPDATGATQEQPCQAFPDPPGHDGPGTTPHRPILSHSASIYFPKQGPTLTLPCNFSSQHCGQLDDQDPDGLHVRGGLGDVDFPTQLQALGVG